MSDTDRLPQAQAAEHFSSVPVRQETKAHLSDNFSPTLRPKDVRRSASEDEANWGQHDKMKGNLQVGDVCDDLERCIPGEDVEKNTSEPITADAEHGAIARDIERRASEHLARRAAEMSLENDEHTDSTLRAKQNQQLPETPPRPRPPRKDSGPREQAVQGYDEKYAAPSNEDAPVDVPEAPQGTSEPTGSEIQNIMDQFSYGMGGPGEQEIMSPLMDRQQPVLVLPPRSSSLEQQPSFVASSRDPEQSTSPPLMRQPTGDSVLVSSVSRTKSADKDSITSANTESIYKPPPPSAEPTSTLPFDFHRFLEQLRHKSADPVARFLRSFLTEFAKKQWAVHEQVKIISDFLEFIAKKMGQCEVWRTVSDEEFDNAREGMEKLVMNRLYSQTFSPAIPAAVGSPRKGSKLVRSAADQASPHGPGRRGQHQEDVERDDVIAQKIKIYGWIRDEHLDMKPIGEKGKKFLGLAQQELLKINSYRAPRDKVICVLNCCKVIFGYLRNAKSDQSADAFIPLLIYTVLQARPESLVSNVQYIWRFRNQEKLGGETGYYMSSLMGVVTFIENLDRTNLTITDDEFERSVEQAVSAIAEKNRAGEFENKPPPQGAVGPMQHLNEKGALSRAEVTAHNSEDAERSTPRRNYSQRHSEKVAQASSGHEDEDGDPVTGLLRSIQKPLSSIGRMFSDDASNEKQNGARFTNTPELGSSSRGVSPSARLDGNKPSTERRRTVEDATARQASVETAQAQQLRAKEHQVVVETLQSMFPNLDKDVIADVVRAEEGNVGRAVDACLVLSG